MNLQNVLNERIADFSVLYFKLHRFHWFVQGSDFHTFHKIYEDLYNEVTLYIDEFAERVLALEGVPIATLREYLNITGISEDGEEVTPLQIGNTLLKDFSYIVEKLKLGIKVSETEDDYVTSDLLTTTMASIQKHMWMIRQTVKGL